MKKSSAFAGLFAGILALLTFSCESLDGLVQAPTAEVKSVSIAGLDLDGISFNFIVSRQGMQIRFTLPSRFHLQKILNHVVSFLRFCFRKNRIDDICSYFMQSGAIRQAVPENGQAQDPIFPIIFRILQLYGAGKRLDTPVRPEIILIEQDVRSVGVFKTLFRFESTAQRL